MSHSPALYQWRTQIAQHFPNLSQPLVMGLALWSLGMIMVRSCSLTAIADGWSAQGGQTFYTAVIAQPLEKVKLAEMEV